MESRKKKAGLKPKLSDEARHKRFVDVAREVEADESKEAFDRAFERIVIYNPNKARDD
jgi:hypothetical protein